MHRKIINALMKWLRNTFKMCLLLTILRLESYALMKWLGNISKMCLLLTILRLESFVETGVRDPENELFF